MRGLLILNDLSSCHYVVLCKLFFISYDVFLVFFSIFFGDVLVEICFVVFFLR
jgi:hypothetical protein